MTEAVAVALAAIKKEKTEEVPGLEKEVAGLKANLLAEEGRLPRHETEADQQPAFNLNQGAMLFRAATACHCRSLFRPGSGGGWGFR